MKFRSTVLATSLAVAALAIAAQASASCSYPKAPDRIPDGTKATKEEMLAGMKTMRAYNDLVAKYTDCLKSDHDAAVAKIDPGQSPDKKEGQKAELDKILQQKNDAAVDEAQVVTNRFNDQIKAFKAAHTN
jgi:exosome complex RNA-binding protein Csl4